MEFEFRRKAFHIGLGSLGLVLIYHELFYLVPAVAILIVALTVSLLSRSHEIPVVEFIMDLAERDHHRKRFPGKGSISALAAVILVVAIFDRGAELAAVTALTFGDSMSHLIGVNYGRHSNPLNPEKDLEGFAAGFLATTGILLLFLSPFTAIFASFIGMVVESLDVTVRSWSVSDNFTVPLAAAVAVEFFQIYIIPMI